MVVGGSGWECNGPDTVTVDKDGHVLIAGCTDSTDYAVTKGAFQARNAGRYDGVLTVLSNDLSSLLYSTYLGGAGDDMLRACCAALDGSVCVAGCTGSPGPNDFPTNKAYQKVYGGLPGYVNPCTIGQVETALWRDSGPYCAVPLSLLDALGRPAV